MGFSEALEAPRYYEPSGVWGGAFFWGKDPELSDSHLGPFCKKKKKKR